MCTRVGVVVVPQWRGSRRNTDSCARVHAQLNVSAMTARVYAQLNVSAMTARVYAQLTLARSRRKLPCFPVWGKVRRLSMASKTFQLTTNSQVSIIGPTMVWPEKIFNINIEVLRRLENEVLNLIFANNKPTC